MVIMKKDGSKEDFNREKIKAACLKAAARSGENLDNDSLNKLSKAVKNRIKKNFDGTIRVESIHELVIAQLERFGYHSTASCYAMYRNYKQDFATILDDAYAKECQIRYIGDKSNANTDSSMVCTQRSLSYGIFSSALYNKFFLTEEELRIITDGYLYIHDKKDRRDTFNCCIADIKNVLENGFEMANMQYTDPKSLVVAFDVIEALIMSMAAQQYGGFTVPEIDKLLAPYAQKSYDKHYKEYYKIISEFSGIMEEDRAVERAEAAAMDRVYKEMQQGFQGWEHTFNTVGSSRGDYPFISMSLGLGTGPFEAMVSTVCFQVRKEGQGAEGQKKPVLFPKLTFLYDEKLHGEGGMIEHVFKSAIECSGKAMYPDYLSLTGEGYIPEMYKKYGTPISLMGCRASLSPWYEEGGMYPAHEEDKPVFVGRFNLGVISLNLPMIYQKSVVEGTSFDDELVYYMNVARQLHIRTFNYLGEKRAGTNPLGFMQGGFYGGNLGANDKIKSILKPMTLSFGITALEELQRLHNGKSLIEDNSFALKTMERINELSEQFKKEDDLLYAIYGTPAESLCGRQVEQFVAKYGVIENVSDRAYNSNSFHCHVTSDITPMQKQDAESEFWHLFDGGKIQYCKYPTGDNLLAIETLVRRAMKIGLYEGVNLELSYCEDCGADGYSMDTCTNCGSTSITRIDRMNGYLGYTRVKGDTRFNKAKEAEIGERVSM